MGVAGEIEDGRDEGRRTGRKGRMRAGQHHEWERFRTEGRQQEAVGEEGSKGTNGEGRLLREAEEEGWFRKVQEVGRSGGRLTTEVGAGMGGSFMREARRFRYDVQVGGRSTIGVQEGGA